MLGFFMVADALVVFFLMPRDDKDRNIRLVNDSLAGAAEDDPVKPSRSVVSYDDQASLLFLGEFKEGCWDAFSYWFHVAGCVHAARVELLYEIPDPRLLRLENFLVEFRVR